MPATGVLATEKESDTDRSPDSSAVNTTSGHGQGYWGAIPEPVDSVSATFDNYKRKGWEYVLLVPYQIIDIPLRLIFGGIGAGYRFLDNRHVTEWLADFFGPTDRPYRFEPTLKAGGLDKFGLGLSIYHDKFINDRNRLKLRGVYTITTSQKYSLGVIFDEGGGFEAQFGVGYRLRTRARYFGLGPDSRPENESFYEQEAAWIGVSGTQRFLRIMRVEAALIYSGVAARSTDEDGPRLEDVFPPALIPLGFGERSDGTSATLSLLLDTTREDGRPNKGTVLQVKSLYFNGVDDLNTNFSLFRADVEQFVPLWHVRRALALRAYINWIDRQTTDVPFQRLMTNDEPDLYRGYKDFRWRDRGMVGFTAEYRFPMWNLWSVDGLGIDGFLYTDIGQVFYDFKQIEANRVTESYGFGLRLITKDGFRTRLEFGWSEEEYNFRLGFDQTFQYSQDGLYNGREKSIYR